MLVTGGAGFIGSHFVRYQLAQYPGVQVVNFDKLTYAGNLDNLTGVDESRYTFVRGDIADAEAIRAAMEGCDAVVNFAAETHVDRSLMGASEFIDTDVRGVFNIVEAAKQLGTARVLLVSTDEVYGSIDEGAFTEDDPDRAPQPVLRQQSGRRVHGTRLTTRASACRSLSREGSNTYGHQSIPPRKCCRSSLPNAIDSPASAALQWRRT